MLKEEEIHAEFQLTVAQRRAFMALPLAERRQILAEQADELLNHYNDKTVTDERTIWQGGDIVEL